MSATSITTRTPVITSSDTSFALEAIRNALLGDFCPDLRSEWAKSNAKLAALVIARLIAPIRVAPTIEQADLTKWDLLRNMVPRALSEALRHAECSVDDSMQVDYLSAVRSRMALLQVSLRAVSFTDLMSEFADPSSGMQAWFEDLIGACRDIVEKYEGAVPTSARFSSYLQSIDPEGIQRTLSGYLERRFPGLPSASVLTLKLVSGGWAKRTALFELAPNDFLPTHLALRCDMPGAVTGTQAANEFPLLETAYVLGIPVPRPIVAETDLSVLGGTFLIVESIAGTPGDYFPELLDRSLPDIASIGPDFCTELAQALARLHSLRDLPSSGPMAGYDSSDTSPLASIRQFRKIWLSIDPSAFTLPVDIGFAWLESHPLPRKRPTCVVHGDVGMQNMILKDGHLAALVDWEIAHLGDPSEDVGYCYSLHHHGIISWDQFVAAYIASGGNPQACDPIAVHYFALWAHVRGFVYTAMMRQNLLQGRRADIRAAYSGWDAYERLLSYIMRELDIVRSLVAGGP